MKKLHVGIIGCGRISVRHAGAAASSKDCTIVAFCDTVRERAAALASKYGGNVYTDYKEMLDTERPDAVHICLPHYLHTEVSRYALARGINVLCEKPMSIDYESAVSTVELAESKGLLYGIIFQCRYNTSAQLVKKAIESGKLGKILSARSTLTWSRPDSYYQESDWKGTWEKEGGGVVIDQAIHSIDLVNWLVDSEAERVSCSMANRGHVSVKVEDSAEGLVTYKNGVKYGFYCMNNYACNEPIEIRLCCEKGKVIFGYDDAVIFYDDGTKEEVHQDTSEVFEGGMNYWGYRHKRQIEQFYAACRGNEKLEISGREALKTQRLICEIYRIGRETIK